MEPGDERANSPKGEDAKPQAYGVLHYGGWAAKLWEIPFLGRSIR